MQKSSKYLLILMLACSALGRAQKEIYVEPLRAVNAFVAPIRLGSSSNVSGLIAVASADNSIKVYDAQTLTEQAAFVGLDQPCSALALGEAGKLLLSASASGQVTLWDLDSKRKLKDLVLHTAGVVALAVLPQGLVLTASIDQSIRITDPVSGVTVASTSRPQEEVAGLALQPTGKTAVLATSAGWIYLLEVPPLGELQKYDTRGRIASLALSPDGKYAALGGFDGSIRLWDLEKSSQKSTLSAQKGTITALAFDPRGRWLVSSSTDSTLRIFDLSTESSVRSIAENDGLVSAVSFVGDETLWAGTTKGILKTWRVLDTPPDTTPPTITISQPEEGPEGFPRVFGNSCQIRGIVQDQNRLKEFIIEGALTSPALTDVQDTIALARGMKAKSFLGRVKLESVGVNTFEIRAVDEFGNVARQTVTIQRLSSEQVIEAIGPPNNYETNKTSVTLQFKSWCEVGSYQVLVNLIEMVSQTNIRNKKEGAIFSDEIPLVVGYNQIQIIVTSKTGEKFTKTLGVSRKMFGAIAVDQAGKPAPKERGPGPQRWALVVGISEYANKSIPALKFADQDAQAFAEFLQKPEGGGYEPDHMRILINKDATLPNLKEAMIDFLSQAIDKDLVVIYFAGHGAPEAARPANLYLLTYDADPARLGTTAYPMWQIQDILLRYVSAKKVVVFSDACHSGGISVDFAIRGVSTPESNMINQYLADLGRTKDGIVVFTASAAGEVSQELPELGHGVFTYYLLEGMKGEADFDNDYTVTINELMQYVEEQVKRKTKGAQNPTRSQTNYDKDLTISLIAH
jgi:WD40 repeat protein